ncbi:hypothetical protein L226DRAFT_537305 [Lentinus tigrinus ALCF2SS1-7]|uniref:uncharacterized protein n=1 Tax=Lentinus tigrinus ALCF2SS1-7 TaxID=1328758 RepID=UPI0011661371|nr:hypothetical protein L226DRAFT_537305 [Lentinus tigrinus ALCF2SS1-7]
MNNSSFSSCLLFRLRLLLLALVLRAHPVPPDVHLRPPQWAPRGFPDLKSEVRAILLWLLDLVLRLPRSSS